VDFDEEIFQHRGTAEAEEAPLSPCSTPGGTSKSKERRRSWLDRVKHWHHKA
jgi:hypothetical protein